MKPGFPSESAFVCNSCATGTVFTYTPVPHYDRFSGQSLHKVYRAFVKATTFLYRVLTMPMGVSSLGTDSDTEDSS